MLYSFFNLGARWGGCSTSRFDRFIPGKETRYPLYRRLGRPQDRSGRVRKISPPPGFDPRTIQPVASRYTDYAIPTHELQTKVYKSTTLEKKLDDICTIRRRWDSKFPDTLPQCPWLRHVLCLFYTSSLRNYQFSSAFLRPLISCCAPLQIQRNN